MSFILDALRKSEHERQRQTGPGLAEVPIAVARPKANVWAAAAIALLVVNLLAVGVYLLRRAQKTDAPAASTTAVAPAPAAPGAANPTLAAPAAAPVSPQGPVTQGATPPRVAAGEPAGSGSRNPLADEVGSSPQEFEPGPAFPRVPTPRPRRAWRRRQVPRVALQRPAAPGPPRLCDAAATAVRLRQFAQVQGRRHAGRRARRRTDHTRRCGAEFPGQQVQAVQRLN